MSRPTQPGCLICGASPTVKSHIFPRSLMHAIKDGGHALHAASQHQVGWSQHQSGLWDDTMLCEQHERSTADYDDYAVRFWRRHRSLPRSQGKSFVAVNNPDPDVLVRFAYSIVWRWVHSKYGRRAGCSLGPYDTIIQAAVFNSGPLPLAVLVFETDLRHADQLPADMGVSPYRTRLLERTGWLFRIGTMDFFIYCDQRSIQAPLRPIVANGADPIQVFRTDAMPFDKAANLLPLVKNANRRSASGKR